MRASVGTAIGPIIGFAVEAAMYALFNIRFRDDRMRGRPEHKKHASNDEDCKFVQPTELLNSRTKNARIDFVHHLPVQKHDVRSTVAVPFCADTNSRKTRTNVGNMTTHNSSDFFAEITPRR